MTKFYHGISISFGLFLALISCDIEKNEPLLRQAEDKYAYSSQRLQNSVGYQSQQDDVPAKYRIPVVFHQFGRQSTDEAKTAMVLKTYKDMLTMANQHLKNDIANCKVPVPDDWKALMTNPDIELVLATQDPQGGGMLGFAYHEDVTSNVILSENELTSYKKNIILPRMWDSQKYLNIVLLKMTGLPTVVAEHNPSTPDFIIINITADLLKNPSAVKANFKNVGFTNYTILEYIASSFVHELSHMFSLEHLWGSNANNQNCFDDDEVSDTPVQEKPVLYTANPFVPQHDSCSDPVMSQNFLNYAFGQCMHTDGQVVRMHADLDVGSHSGLGTNNPGLEPGSCYVDQQEPNDLVPWDITDILAENKSWRRASTLCEGEIDQFSFTLPYANPTQVQITMFGLPADYNLELADSQGLLGQAVNEGTQSEPYPLIAEPGQTYTVTVFGDDTLQYDNAHPYYLAIDIK